MKPIVPEVCDRLNCNIPQCYGWDLCIQARAVATEEEWGKLWNTLFGEEEAEP